MAGKFFIACLPRSRSSWLSKFLAYGATRVGHDVGVNAAGCADLFDKLRQHDGVVETAGMLAWQEVRVESPGTKIIVVRRDVEQVIASLRVKAFPFEEQELRHRASMLDELSQQPGVVTIRYEALASAYTCGWLFEHCLGIQFDMSWWERLRQINIQIDLDGRLAQLIANARGIALTKTELAPQPLHDGRFVIAVEPWGSIWPEAQQMISEHLREVEHPDDVTKKLRGMDHQLMRQMERAGLVKIITARQDGRLVGYLTWTKAPDVESTGLLLARQGGWYVKPGLVATPAVAMFDRSVTELRLDGVQTIYPHHRVAGRGAGLGKFFARRGARLVQHEYCMQIGAS